MPVTDLVLRLEPPAPADVREAAERLRYRDFLTVCLVVRRPTLFPDNWIYVHDSTVRVGRIQNYKNWSPDMVADPAMTSLGLEYFCDEGDDLWTRSDGDLVALATTEVERLGLADARDVVDGCVVRVPKAYPIYDATYCEHVSLIRGYLDGLENVQTIGRNGLHRYDNQDHAMLTGLLAARNLLDGAAHDVWAVNTEQEYQEEIRLPEGTRAPGVLLPGFAKLDRMALGVATGIVGALGLALATLVLVLRGGTVIGPHLALLAQFIPGYEVTFAGSLIGFAVVFAYGFAAGALLGTIYNGLVARWGRGE
jgi:hypothetical protein